MQRDCGHTLLDLVEIKLQHQTQLIVNLIREQHEHFVSMLEQKEIQHISGVREPAAHIAQPKKCSQADIGTSDSVHKDLDGHRPPGSSRIDPPAHFSETHESVTRNSDGLHAAHAESMASNGTLSTVDQHVTERAEALGTEAFNSFPPVEIEIPEETFEEKLPTPRDSKTLHGLLYLAFFVFTVFGMTNVITGIFVENACTIASMDRTALVDSRLEEQRRFRRGMTEIFNLMDQDQTGTLNMKIFRDILDEERIRVLLATLGLSCNNALQLFTLLDEDCTGNVSIDEFLDGCEQLRGPSKNIDVVSLRWETRKISSLLSTLLETAH